MHGGAGRFEDDVAEVRILLEALDALGRRLDAVTLGGEKKVEVPAEEITVRLASGRTVGIVQELSSPPFAPGERVRVQYEKVDEPGTTPRMRVVRD